MNALRILMTADGRRELWTYVMELTRALAAGERDVEVLLAVMGPELEPWQVKEAGEVPHCQLQFRPFAAEWMQDPWHDVVQAGEWLLGLEEHFSPDVVHLNHYCHGSLPWTAPVVVVAHGCLLSAWQAVHGEGSPRSWTRYHAEVASGVRGANLVVASTRAMFDSLERLYAPIPKLSCREGGSRFPEFRLVANGLDGGWFEPLEKREVVFVSGNEEVGALNFEMLNTVAERLAWPVYVAGSGRLPALNWLFLGDDVDAVRAQAAVFALPSRYEPFGFEPLKAAFAGCALLLSDLPCLRETWEGAALFVPAGDAERFKGALERLMADPGLQAEMARRARARAEQLTAVKMASGMLECYFELEKKQASPRHTAVI